MLPRRDATGLRAGKAAREGAPSQKTCRLASNRTPRGREDSLKLRLLAVLVAAFVFVPSAAAIRVHVRVEGQTRNTFRSTRRVRDVTATRFSGTGRRSTRTARGRKRSRSDARATATASSRRTTTGPSCTRPARSYITPARPERRPSPARALGTTARSSTRRRREWSGRTPSHDPPSDTLLLGGVVRPRGLRGKQRHRNLEGHARPGAARAPGRACSRGPVCDAGARAEDE